MRPVAVLFLAVALAAPVAAQSDTLRLTWWTDVGFPTPFAVSTLGPAGVVRLTLLYDTLVWKDAHGLIPWLAESWRTTPDGLTYAFTLRPSVQWHDGEPLTARDVKFTFDYYRAHPFRWMDTSMVRAVEVPDRRTVVIRLVQPYAPFLENIAGVVPIIPEHVWQGRERPEEAQETRFAVGSGPYRLVEYRPEAGQYRFAAFEHYFRGRPRIAEIQYVVTPIERQVLAVQSGQVQMAMASTYDVVSLFAGHPYLRVLETDPLSIARLIFHLDRPPTDQRPFRQAIAHALDLPRIAEIITRGPAPAGSPGVVPPTDPWFSSKVASYPYDPPRARALLQSLGFLDRDGDGWLEGRDGARLTLDLVSSPVRDVEIVRQMLKEVGVDVQLRTADPAARAQLAGEGRFQMLLSTHIGSGGDPDYLRTWFTGADANQFASGSAMRSPEYLRLARLQLQALDPVQRRGYIEQMQVLLSRELPTLPLYYRRFFWIYDRRAFTPFASPGGLLNGIPLVENKMAFLSR